MPPRSIKVIHLNQEPAPPEQPLVEDSPIEAEQLVQEEEPSEQYEPDVDSDDLEDLVKEYTKQKKQKRRETEQKVGCNHCGKQMSAKSLRYSHQMNCKADPANQPPPPPPPLPTEPVKMKIKRSASVARSKPKAKPETETEHVIIAPEPEELKPSLTTNYVRLMELKRSQKQSRIKSLASQAF